MKQHVLIIGRAKTGTTIISKVIQNSMENCDYYLEPKRISFFEHDKWSSGSDSIVVKIIFEHWDKTPRLRNAVIYNECILKFHKIIAIVRDLRDELISRMFYVIFPKMQSDRKLSDEGINKWIETLIKKEEMPESISVVDMISIWNELSGGDFLRSFYKIDYFKYLESHSERLHIIKYEDFIEKKFQDLENYLGFELVFLDDLGNLNRTSRSNSYNNWKRYFTEKDITIFREMFGDLLAELGYLDWSLQPGPLNPAQGSGYVTRLLEEAKNV